MIRTLGNYSHISQLLNVLHFMRDKPDQVSGLKGELRPEDVYERFTAALRNEGYDISKDALEDMAGQIKNGHSESLWVKVSAKEAGVGGGNDQFTFGFEIDDFED